MLPSAMAHPCRGLFSVSSLFYIRPRPCSSSPLKSLFFHPFRPLRLTCSRISSETISSQRTGGLHLGEAKPVHLGACRLRTRPMMTSRICDIIMSQNDAEVMKSGFANRAKEKL
ncbi:uncharacterized protein LOC122040902 [Zingiber officinale]|uniref:uncharacterized protein LOC122040902 n=1 Tax=Zingiber officinale TaxID=94328 RepID=UPI001C4BD2C0|nr:uncharacterized protein LOC122040902 [Zingiber officinale]